MHIHKFRRLSKEEQIAAEIAFEFDRKEHREWVLPHLEPRIELAEGLIWTLGGRKWHLTHTDGSIFATGMAGLRVMYSGSREADDKRWIHLSISREGGRLPSWLDMVTVKEAWLGPESRAIQIFPPRSEYVNDTPNVLHLWECIDDPNLLPDFRKYNPLLGKATI